MIAGLVLFVAQGLPSAPAAAAQTGAAAAPIGNAAPAARPARFEFSTRHAGFRAVGYDELPGWKEDELLASWPALTSSCAVLRRREHWREVCDQADKVPRRIADVRAFYEARFTPLRILNSDASREGEITGYFEPLLDGRTRADAEYDIPVLGVPRDLYSLDWSKVPAARRQGIVHVVPEGNTLSVLAAAGQESFALDLRNFDLDTRDRRLRIRLTREGGTRLAQPYHTRAELAALGPSSGIDAPVLAWVRDPMALYAMQVQGSGRIRMADSTVMRVQFGDQNGHPFRPVRVVAKDRERIVTRGLGGTQEEADQFELDLDAATQLAQAGSAGADNEPEVVTRGIAVRRTAATVPAAAVKAPEGQDAAALALVEELLSGRRAGPVAPARPAPPAPSTTVAAADRPRSATADATKAPVDASPALVSGARSTLTDGLLNNDPSYVFFKVAEDQRPGAGPRGALGVPLTPERSVAVDPRVTPLGYPVFLVAPAPAGSSIDMNQLVFAQDTGGAIRGAVRADYFWGFGSKAGRLARGTKHRGQMWLLMPKEEVAALSQGAIVTRSLTAAPRRPAECLVADENFCQEID